MIDKKLSIRETVVGLWKIRDLRTKLIFTAIILIIFRIAANISIPGVSLANGGGSVPNGNTNSNNLVDLLGMLGGGGLKQFSLVALGVSPYIMGTVIVQLLSSDIIPSWTKMMRSGELGRKKMDLIARYLTTFIAFAQAYALSVTMQSSGYISFQNTSFWSTFYVMVTLVAGSFASLWFADKISQKGIGNGTSLIIFSGIVANLPWNFVALFQHLFLGSSSTQGGPTAPIIGTQIFNGILDFVFYIVMFFVVLFIVIYVQLALRKIPTQHVGSGLNMNQTEISYIPLRINSAGVIPVIFASALLTTPITIAQFAAGQDTQKWFNTFFSLQSPLGILIYFVLIWTFTYFYSHITVNSEDMAKNFKKSGSFIPGVRPGIDTQRHISKTINRLNFFGGFFLAFVSSVPYIFSSLKSIPASIAIGGTGIIILIGTAIDTITQVQGRIIQRSYSDYRLDINSKFISN